MFSVHVKLSYRIVSYRMLCLSMAQRAVSKRENDVLVAMGSMVVDI